MPLTNYRIGIDIAIYRSQRAQMMGTLVVSISSSSHADINSHVHNNNYIQAGFKMEHRNDLKCKFVLKVEHQHPALIIYADEPDSPDSIVIRVDMVFIQDEDGDRANQVRVQARTWSVFNDDIVYQKEFMLIKSLPDITNWCIQYQVENEEYDRTSNNCRKFMIELANELKLDFPDKYPMEELWYKVKDFKRKNKKKPKSIM